MGPKNSPTAIRAVSVSRELEVARSFLGQYPQFGLADSLARLSPPNPDFSYRADESELRRLELTEAVDRSVAQRRPVLDNYDELISLLESHELADALAKRFGPMHWGVAPRIGEGPDGKPRSYGKRLLKKACKELPRALIEGEPVTYQTGRLLFVSGLPDAIEEVIASPSNSTGFSFPLRSVVSYDCVVNRISEKAQKLYNSPGGLPVDLLVYFYMQRPHWGDWPDKVDQYLMEQEHYTKLHFENIFLYNARQARLIRHWEKREKSYHSYDIPLD